MTSKKNKPECINDINNDNLLLWFGVRLEPFLLLTYQVKKVPIPSKVVKSDQGSISVFKNCMTSYLDDLSLSNSHEIVLKLCFCLKVFRDDVDVVVVGKKRIQSLTPFDNCLMKRAKQRDKDSRAGDSKSGKRHLKKVWGFF